MGTYTDFSVAGYPLINSKRTVVPEAMTVFRESDKRVFARRFGDRNPLVWGDAYADEADETETATVYVCSTDKVIARLDVMGFTINRVRRDFQAGRQSELAMYQEWAEGEPVPPWFADKVKLIESLSFDEYLGGLRQVLSEGLRPKPFDDNERPGLSPAARYILDDNDDYLFGFFASDIGNSVLDNSFGSDCVRFDAVVEERDHPRLAGSVLIQNLPNNLICRRPHSPGVSLIWISFSERYVQGEQPLATTVKHEFEPFVRSLQFMPPPYWSSKYAK